MLLSEQMSKWIHFLEWRISFDVGVPSSFLRAGHVSGATSLVETGKEDRVTQLVFRLDVPFGPQAPKLLPVKGYPCEQPS